MSSACIGVNALYLIPGGVGGTEIYLRSLLSAMADLDRQNRYVVFTNRETGADLVPARDNFQRLPQPVSARNRPGRILFEQTLLPWAAARHGVKVLFNPGFTAPLLALCPNVTVFHDLQHKRHPENFRWFDLPFWRFLLFFSALRSCRIIAVSQSTADDLTLYYRTDRNKIRVVPHGVDEEFFAIAKSRQPGKMLLCVSTLHPHKNLDRLIEAFAGFHELYPEYRLTIAGLRGFYADELESLRSRLGLNDCVRFTGWIPREELYGLFRQAIAFLYPSRFEGFGMPILEALAAGIPSACSDVEPMRSIAGDAAVLFDPNSIPGIQATMVSLTQDQSLIERLAEAGPARATTFSWRAAAQSTIDALLEAV